MTRSCRFFIPLSHRFAILTKNNTDKMPEDETLQPNHDESESEDEEDVVEAIPKIDIDPTTLTPLSPEVISKQVRMSSEITSRDCLTFG
jgi:hypothetical protein